MINIKPLFWRSSEMPYIEIRKVEDGRKVCYKLHSHTQWSIGAITKGKSNFTYDGKQFVTNQGDLVLINPESPHACNPIEDKAWGYFMIYIDKEWLAQLRYREGLIDKPYWCDIKEVLIANKGLFQEYCLMANCLFDNKYNLLEKQASVVRYFTKLMHALNSKVPDASFQVPYTLKVLADYLTIHCTNELSLNDLCSMSGYSPSYLIKSFKKYYGMTPYAYMINKRIQYGKNELKKGMDIADTALDTGFSDQAHFQRTFKQLVAATPNQYRKPLSS